MASIDEAYLDLTGTERLHGPPLAAAHRLHAMVKEATDLNCSIGASSSRLVAKIASDQAKPNGVLWIVPGREAEFLAPLDVRKIPGVGKVTEKNLHACGIRKVGDLAALDDAISRRRGSGNGGWRWRERRAGRMRAGGSTARSARAAIRNRSAMSTRSWKTPRIRRRSTRCWCGFPRWSRGGCAITGCMRGRCRSNCAIRIFRRSRGRGLSIMRRQIDTELAEAARALFHKAWTGKKIRLLGVYAQSLECGRRADQPAGRGEDGEVAEDASGCRQDSR